MSVLRKLINQQLRLSSKLESLLPAKFGLDGNQDFIHDFVSPFITAGAVVYDVGGGKQPMIGASTKAMLGIRVVGVDIDQAELCAAPRGAYDQIVCCDITKYRGEGDADVVLCQALLEHVPDTAAALRSIESILKPGGVALLFVPSGNAVYARLNRLIPENLKRKILFSIFPATARAQGFPAYYNNCTPRGIQHAARRLGLITESLKLYYHSNYFAFLAPLYALWRAWTLAFYAVDKEQAAETFSLALRKPAIDLPLLAAREKAGSKVQVSSPTADGRVWAAYSGTSASQKTLS